MKVKHGHGSRGHFCRLPFVVNVILNVCSYLLCDLRALIRPTFSLTIEPTVERIYLSSPFKAKQKFCNVITSL